jgi:hypothetical protein
MNNKDESAMQKIKNYQNKINKEKNMQSFQTN